MPRRKITSTSQKKAEQKLKRAIKRGDVEAPEPKKKINRKKARTRIPIGPARSSSDAGKRLQLRSTFVKLSPKFLEDTRKVAFSLPLDRPLSPQVAVLTHPETGTFNASAFTCPRRPKWRFDMSKLEVERNEEGRFKEWLAESDNIVEKWQGELDAKRQAAAAGSDDQDFNTETQLIMPASPTYFERNLEVWRQLWRVTEISQIILILLDSRCPSVHFPPSLVSYLGDRKIILILTKVDITGPERTNAWKEHLHSQYPTLPIVEVESYAQKDETAVHQGKRQFTPGIPDNFRAKLVEAIKKAHSELLEPPEKVKEKAEQLKAWVPPVKPEVDWDAVFTAKGDKVGLAVGGPAASRLDEEDDHDDEHGEVGNEKEKRAPDILTIGLIGQPNVGKSSLLNALFGASRVRTSKTPGKTKHFQTLFWTSDVRLVDCPGLVFPNFVPMEMQVLSGILPISRVSAMAASIHYASERLPLEGIFQLRHPSIDEAEAPTVDKRTWREGMVRAAAGSQDKPAVWTAMDILTAFANMKGWVTAQAGRPDMNRAGNAILRALAEGRVSWGFWPPGAEKTDADGLGIWIPGNDAIGSDTESDNDEHEHATHSTEEASDDDDFEEESDDDHSDGGQIVGIAGRFGALTIDEREDSEASEE